MSFTKAVKFFFCAILIMVIQQAMAQGRPNWTVDDLLDPSELSTTIKSNKNVPVIFSIGPGAIIPKSVDIGMVKEAANMQKFKGQLENLPRDSEIVIYCGCCPFDRCPNVRPAIQVMKGMKFTNYRLLDLPHNIKIDWIDKGYPTEN
jgi:hypothetical protein